MKFGSNKIFNLAVLVLGATLTLMLSSFQQPPTLKGNWIFQGGVYNGRPDPAPTAYSLQRRYKDTTFDAYMLEKGEKPLKYQSGRYGLQLDTCLETETYSLNPSKLTNVTVHYQYAFRNDTLVLSGTLPTGMVVQEYWKKQQ